jgi:heat shock protein HslJ
MNKRILFAVIVVVLAGIAWALSLSTKPAAEVSPEQGNVNLNGSTFRLITYRGADFDISRRHLLTFEEDSIQAKFCNSMNGTYVLENGIITVERMAATKMFCGEPADLMGLEMAFQNVLAAGAGFLLEGSTLTLTDRSGEKWVFSIFMD